MHPSLAVLHQPNWQDHRRGAVSWTPPPVATTVVVPHPDDEALLFGGLIRFQRSRGIDVHVIAVTDGEAAYPHLDPSALAVRRCAEQEASLGLLGVSPSSVTRLSLPDGAVADHERIVSRAVADVGAPLVVTPWIHDHHCDHEACGRAAVEAAMTSGAMVIAGLFWAWHHTDPDRLDSRLLCLDLDASAQTSKNEAIACHVSQLHAEQPVLTTAFLEPATTDREYYIDLGKRTVNDSDRSWR